MKRDTPLSVRTKWALVAATVLLHPVLLYLLLPVFGEAANSILALGPVTATLLFDWRVGGAATVVNVLVSSRMFASLTTMTAREGIPKALFSGFTVAILCFGAEKLRRYIQQRKVILAELRQAKKMEAMGRLAGGVAHDINNTLNSIMASVFSHRQELVRFGGQFPDLDNIAAARDRGAQLTRNLLGFVRKSDQKRQTISINEAVESVHALLKRTTSKNIRMELRLDADRPCIVGDRAQLESALMNLCVNALDAMATGGTLTMSTGKDADRVHLCVEDTGIGMDASIKERVFEPFFTTKAAGKGTGLGLSMVYGAVHAMSGRIVLDTAPGKGSAFTLLFPKATAVAQRELTPSPPPVNVGPVSLSGRTVLVIDDEPLVLRSGMRLLRAMGCEVLSAPSGREGIDVVKELDGAVDLVIVDFIMPGLDGVAVVEALQQIKPSIPVVLASGYAGESERLDSLRRRFRSVGFLAKPYQSDELLTVARGLLAARTEVEAPVSCGLP